MSFAKLTRSCSSALNRSCELHCCERVDMPSDIRDVPPWMQIANAEARRGVLELAGPADNPRIVEYLATTTIDDAHRHDATPWCSAFVNWCLREAGIAGTGLANARSWLYWGQPLQLPQLGCVAVFSSPRGPAAGHVGFYFSEYKSEHVLVLGGNQDNRVRRAAIERGRLLGYRWPITLNSAGAGPPPSAA